MESLRGQQDEDATHTNEENSPDRKQDPYVEARALLQLPESFSEDEFVNAYRRKIRSAHPDRGGTTQDAQAVNEARVIIARRNGWDKT